MSDSLIYRDDIERAGWFAICAVHGETLADAAVWSSRERTPEPRDPRACVDCGELHLLVGHLLRGCTRDAPASEADDEAITRECHRFAAVVLRRLLKYPPLETRDVELAAAEHECIAGHDQDSDD